MRAFDDPNLNDDMDGMSFWYQVLQTAGYNLESILAEFYRLLDREVKRFRKEIRALPRVRGNMDISGDMIRILLDSDGVPEGWVTTCRMRPATNSSLSDYIVPRVRDGRFVIERSTFGNNQFECQLGLSHQRTGDTIYEPWFRVQF